MEGLSLKKKRKHQHRRRNRNKELADEAEDLRRQQQGMDKEKAKRAEEEARMLEGTRGHERAAARDRDAGSGCSDGPRPSINRWTTKKSAGCEEVGTL